MSGFNGRFLNEVLGAMSDQRSCDACQISHCSQKANREKRAERIVSPIFYVHGERKKDTLGMCVSRLSQIPIIASFLQSSGSVVESLRHVTSSSRSSSPTRDNLRHRSSLEEKKPRPTIPFLAQPCSFPPFLFVSAVHYYVQLQRLIVGRTLSQHEI